MGYISSKKFVNLFVEKLTTPHLRKLYFTNAVKWAFLSLIIA